MGEKGGIEHGPPVCANQARKGPAAPVWKKRCFRKMMKKNRPKSGGV